MGSGSVRAGKVLDVRTGEVSADQVITFEAGRIVEVAPWTPQHSRVNMINWRDHLVIPGMIDLHTHLIGTQDQVGMLPFAAMSAAAMAFEGVRNARATLRSGFTTVRDLGTYRAFVDRDLKRAIESGIVPGPRMHVAGGFVTTSTGGGELTELEPDVLLPESLRFGVADSADEARAVVRRLIHGGADVIKVMATGAVLTEGTRPGAPEYSELELRAIVDEAALNGVYVAAHAHGEEGTLRALRAGVRSIEHGTTITPDVIEAFLSSDAFYVPTTYLFDWLATQDAYARYSESTRMKLEQVKLGALQGLRDAIDARVKIAYGTDAIVIPHGLNGRQFRDFTEAGMSSVDAIRTATLTAAECLGDEAVGALEVGRWADMVAVDTDLLNNVRHLEDVRGVIKGGELFA